MNETRIRCAVYTRKSSEEGLEQAFNSLDAQREAGLDYIRSQKHQGWVAVQTAYDDGGYSGGNIERPGLKRLLDDINEGRIDIVVVYKVDRLSRSLADFARLMQTFDERKVSFVSVTQQFNTTTSMGRLTLNMLLSFAQFEREVTGERIRDKIAATKRTGVWVAGQPPLGYRVSRPGDVPADRRLRIVEPEAAIIRTIYTAYLELKSLLGVAQHMNKAGHTTRRWLSSRGVDHGGTRFTATMIYRILTHPVYAGKITHYRGSKMQVFPGLHEPIIDPKLWDEVQSLMDSVQRQPPPVRWTHTHLLRGKIRTFEGFAMSPASVQKKSAADRGLHSRVFYYCSQKGLKQGYKTCPIKTINARHLDDLVRALVLDHLMAAHKIDLRPLEPASRDHWIREVIGVVMLATETITVDIKHAPLDACKAVVRRAMSSGSGAHTGIHGADADRAEKNTAIPRCVFTPQIKAQDGRTTLTFHIKIKRHDNRRVLVAPDGRDLFLTYAPSGDPIPQPHLVRALAQAFAFHRDIVHNGATVDAVASRARLVSGRVWYLLHLTRLSPAIINAALSGRLGPSVRLRDLHAAADHVDWSLQAAALSLQPHPTTDVIMG